MMSDNGATATYRLAGPEIISETFDDGESVVVNLENGFYFSLNPIGGLVFSLLGAGFSTAAVEDELRVRYTAEADAIHSSVAGFATRLVEEGLLVAGTPDLGSPLSAVTDTLPAPSGEEPAPFEAPTIFAYTDMQDLLLADPIHDYDDTGWPARVDER